MWNTIGATVYLFCQWLITIIVVWQYDDYINAGNLALAMSVTNFFFCIAVYNIRAFQVSDASEEYTDSDYVSARVLTCALSVILCAIFIYAFDYSALQRNVILCYMIFRAIEALIDVMHGIDQKHWRMDFIGISAICRGVLILATFSLLGWFYGFLPAIIAMAVVSALVGIIFDLKKTRSLAKFSFSARKKVFILLLRCSPLMIVGLTSVFIATFTRTSVEMIYGENALGIYASVVAPTLIIQAIAMFILNPLVNVFTKYLNDSNKQSFEKLLILVSVIIIGLSAIVYTGAHILGNWGLTLLFGESITPHTYLLPGAVIVAGLTVCIWFLSVVYSIIRDIIGLLIGSTIGAIIAVLITSSFLIRYDLNGVNYIMIISNAAAVIFLIIRYLAIKKKIWRKVDA